MKTQGFKTLLIATISMLAGEVFACPLCKEAVSQNEGNFASGFAWSIVLMLGILFSMIGFGVFQVYRIARAESQAGR